MNPLAQKLWQVNISTLFCLVTCLPSAAQVVPDSTLPVNSIVTHQENTSEISGGTRTGSNLFHSFSEFSVPTGGTAFFNNANDVSNIFSRVTGGVFSNIDGIIQTRGRANLFLINPNVIIFGANASLNIGGSFVATTANAIAFSNKGTFSASIPNNPSVLSVNPSAFLFNQIAVQPLNSIENKGKLEVTQGRSLLLVGGNVAPNNTSTGGILIDGTVQGLLQAPGGRVEIGAVAAPSTVGLFIDANSPDLMSLTYPSGVEKADVSLTNTANINVKSGNGGSITINGNNINILGSSGIEAGIEKNLGVVGSKAGDITLNATNAIRVIHSRISNSVNEGAVGNGGEINIQAGSLSLTDGSLLGAATFGHGNAGSVSVQTADAVSVQKSLIANGVAETAVGNGGEINIQVGSLSLTDGSLLGAGTFGHGNAGSVSVRTTDAVSLKQSAIANGVDIKGVGNGGEINIQAGSLSLTDGAILGAGTFGQGNAGRVVIKVADTVSANNSAIVSGVAETGVGNGGEINIQTGSLSLTDGALLAAGTSGKGDAGNIQINTAHSVNISGVSPNNSSTGSDNILGISLDGISSRLTTSTETTAQGKGGQITVTTDTLHLSNGAVLNAQTQNNFLGGIIKVEANNLEVTQGGQIITSAYSSGDAGNIHLNVAGNIIVSGSDPTFSDRLAKFGRDAVINVGSASGLFANTDTNSQGNGGNIFISATNLDLINSATVSAQGQGTGSAGNVTINALAKLYTNNGNIIASATEGMGGSVKLAANDIRLRNSSLLTVTSPSQGGNITSNSQIFIALEDSDILANVNRGGDITITAPAFVADIYAKKSGSSSVDFNQLRNNGRVDILSSSGVVTVPDFSSLQNDLSSLSANFISTDSIVQGTCLERRNVTQGKFTVTGTGGLPVTPYDNHIDGWYNLPRGSEPRHAPQQGSNQLPTNHNPSPNWKLGDRIVEAQAIVFTADGGTILSSKPSRILPESADSLVCHQN